MSHCCVCAGVCAHIGGPWPCTAHDPRPAATVPVVLTRRTTEDRADYLTGKLAEALMAQAELGALVARLTRELNNARVGAPPRSAGTAALDRATVKPRVHQALHDLNVRIVGLDKGDCHCNLIAEVVLDALGSGEVVPDAPDAVGM